VAWHRRSVLTVCATLTLAGLIWAGVQQVPKTSPTATTSTTTTSTTATASSATPTPSASPTASTGAQHHDYLKTIRYEKTDGGQVVVTPTAWGRSQLPLPSAVNALLAEYQHKAPRRYRGQQYSWQLKCHAYFAVEKPVWELESRNHRDSYLEYVAHACN
jgi:hypothetical protein